MNIVPAIVAMICLLGAVAFAVWSLHVLFCWPRVTGTFLRYHRKVSDGGAHYHPVYRFQTREGKVYVNVSDWGTWDRPWDRGKPVVVRYSPDNPQRSQIQSFSSLWGGTFWLVLLALVCWAFAVWIPRIGR